MIDEARQQFQRLLGDRNTPASIGERARLMMAVLVSDEAAKAKAPEAPAATDKPPGGAEKAGADDAGKSADKKK